MTQHAIIDELIKVIAGRRADSPDTSYVARMFTKGQAKLAQKVGEEGVETALALVLDDREEVIKESADLFFHLLMALEMYGVAWTEVEAELSRRLGMSGLEEKRNRT